MAKDWRKVYRKLKNVSHLNEFEKWQMARRLAASPDERLAMSEAIVKALGFYELTNEEKIRVSKDFVGIIR